MTSQSILIGTGRPTLIESCYCSDNSRSMCRYCNAKSDIKIILMVLDDDPYIYNTTKQEEQIEEIFIRFNIAPKARLKILIDFDEQFNYTIDKDRFNA